MICICSNVSVTRYGWAKGISDYILGKIRIAKNPKFSETSPAEMLSDDIPSSRCWYFSHFWCVDISVFTY